jgi:hypothetical protein
MKSIDSLLKIADIHAERLKYAMEYLKHKLPVSPEMILNLSKEDLLFFELLNSRFAKLQDFIGNQLFNVLLRMSGEQIEEMTFIDKLNKLEKIKVIPSTGEWMRLRQIRNNLAHEYPEHPELTAAFLNEAFILGTVLLNCLENLKEKISTHSAFM